MPIRQKTSQSGDSSGSPSLSCCRILTTWWPLAASWLLMAAETPMLSAVMARLAAPRVNLAAFGGIVYPLALIIESPIIMLLSASTALSKNWDSYRRVRSFMMWSGAALTLLHILIAFTPLYDIVAGRIIRAPAEALGPARLGLMVLVPWTWTIAYRRFNQGILIRFGHSQSVGLGTLIRLCADVLVLTAGYLINTIPGAAVAGAALAAGVTAEAVYAGLRVRPVLRDELGAAPADTAPLTLLAFLSFYVPLAMTPLLSFMQQPIGSAALGRMPLALESMATWTVISGLVFVLRSPGVSYNEAVIALLDAPDAQRSLRRFAAILAAITTTLLLLVTATPLATFWFERLSALDPALTELARSALWLALPLPALAVLQSWYQGVIVHSRRTGGITESMAIALLTSSAILGLGVYWQQSTGLYVGLVALVAGTLAQVAWLWWRSRAAMRGK